MFYYSIVLAVYAIQIDMETTASYIIVIDLREKLLRYLIL